MSDGNNTAKERYRNRTKRISVSKENYHEVESYLELRTHDRKGQTIKPSPIGSIENRILQESFSILMGTDKYEDPLIDRVTLFAEMNDMTNEEAIEKIVCSVLDDSGHIEETFRKPRLFDSELW